MNSFKIFSGRYLLRILIALPVAWFICFGTGFALGSIAGYFSPETDTSITEEAEEDDFADGFMDGVFGILGGITVVATTGVVSNFMFRTEGSKYVRTIRNSHKHFTKAYIITAITSVISATISSAALAVISEIVTSDTINSEKLLAIGMCTIISALLANVICTGVLFVKSSTIRGIMIMVTMFVPMACSLILSHLADMMIVTICTAAAVVLFAAALCIAGSQIKKRWLFN